MTLHLPAIRRPTTGLATLRIEFDETDFFLKPGLYEIDGVITRLTTPPVQKSLLTDDPAKRQPSTIKAYSRKQRKVVGTATIWITFDEPGFIIPPGLYEIIGTLTRLRKIVYKDSEPHPNSMEAASDWTGAFSDVDLESSEEDELEMVYATTTKRRRIEFQNHSTLTTLIENGPQIISMATYQGDITRELWEADPADSYIKWGYPLGPIGSNFPSDNGETSEDCNMSDDQYDHTVLFG